MPQRFSEMSWPPKEETRLTPHRHTHPDPNHHWHGEQTCDVYCRMGKRFHFHRTRGQLIRQEPDKVDSPLTAAMHEVHNSETEIEQEEQNPHEKTDAEKEEDNEF